MGHLKLVAYKTQPRDLEKLKSEKTAVYQEIQLEAFWSIRRGFESRLYQCLENNRQHLEIFVLLVNLCFIKKHKERLI